MNNRFEFGEASGDQPFSFEGEQEIKRRGGRLRRRAQDWSPLAKPTLDASRRLNRGPGPAKNL